MTDNHNNEQLKRPVIDDNFRQRLRAEVLETFENSNTRTWSWPRLLQWAIPTVVILLLIATPLVVTQRNRHREDMAHAELARLQADLNVLDAALEADLAALDTLDISDL